ncbi:MAG: transposase [Desulfobulbaceae bacterium]|nr:transposase [Desulfobulbaceae bacterium]
MKKRKNYSDNLKARVALDAIKGQKTSNELASEYGIHPNQIGQWKKKLIDGSSEIFSRGKNREAESHEAERDRLYQQIGKLQVEVDWLKKTAGYKT